MKNKLNSSLRIQQTIALYSPKEHMPKQLLKMTLRDANGIISSTPHDPNG